MKDFRDKNILVCGFGIEGESVIEFFLGQKVGKIAVFDEKGTDSFDSQQTAAYEKKGIVFFLGKTPLLKGYDMVVRSPGIPLTHPLIQEAQKENIIISSATKLFFDLCPCQIIGVTGTKGKGTTSTLIYEMLKKAQIDAYLGGNIGVAPLTFLDKLTSSSVVVLELSSFQLQDLTVSPHISVMLMTTSEHLDYHKDVYEYIEAKRNIVRFQNSSDYAVFNKDYPASNESDIYTEARIYKVSREQEVEQGCYVKGEAVWIRMDGREEKVIDTHDILLPGRHNLENVCAAVVAAIFGGAKMKAIVEVLKTFKGLEHRLELAAIVNGVRYYDDSFSTTPETAEAAIEAFTDPVIVILGGSSKNSDFSSLGKVISEKENIKAIIGIGKEWEQIKPMIKNQKIDILFLEGAKDMKQIVLAASKVATLGDIVLLSPACASFDMFKNYKDRGNQFKEEVLNLKKNTAQ